MPMNSFTVGALALYSSPARSVAQVAGIVAICRPADEMGLSYAQYTPPTRRRRRDETVLSRRVGGVNTPVGSRDPVLFTISCADK